MCPKCLRRCFHHRPLIQLKCFPFCCCVWVEKYLLSGTMGRCKICWPWYVDYWRDSSPASGLNTFISSDVREWWWSAHTPSSPILLCSFARKQALRKVSHQKAQYNSFSQAVAFFSVLFSWALFYSFDLYMLVNPCGGFWRCVTWLKSVILNKCQHSSQLTPTLDDSGAWRTMGTIQVLNHHYLIP